jgi:hypothetical protein
MIDNETRDVFSQLARSATTYFIERLDAGWPVHVTEGARRPQVH